MAELTVIIIKIRGRKRTLFAECLERIYREIYDFEFFLKNSDVVTEEIQKEKQQQLQVFDVSSCETYYLKIGVVGEIIPISEEDGMFLDYRIKRFSQAWIPHGLISRG